MTDPLASRRRFLRRTAVAAAAAAALPVPFAARASLGAERELAMFHTHTHETLDLVFAVGERYVGASLTSLNRFLRDHYTGDVGRMDPQVFDLLHRVQAALGHWRPYEVISGYRSPATNTRLRLTRGGGVATRSLHMEGRAIDVRLPGVPLDELRDAAIALQAGGVGYYPDQRFVHIDTGRVRRW